VIFWAPVETASEGEARIVNGRSGDNRSWTAWALISHGEVTCRWGWCDRRHSVESISLRSESRGPALKKLHRFMAPRGSCREAADVSPFRLVSSIPPSGWQCHQRGDTRGGAF